MGFVLTLTVLCALVSVSVNGQEQEDPFDLGKTEDQVEELGLPTVSKVDALEAKAASLFSAGNCEEAISALREYARQANSIANFISRGLEPYYDASRDEKKEFGLKVRPLIPFEKRANGYREKRNRAMVMEAECQAKVGNPKEAAVLFYKALDLIDIENEDWWNRARTQLYSLIGLK